jgi:phosphate transport system permease protein
MKSRFKQPAFFDRICFVLVCLLSALALTPFFMLIFELFKKGLAHFSWDFFTREAPDSMEMMLAQIAEQPVRGGIADGIGGSLLIILTAVLAAVPIGILTGIFIYENRTRELSVMTEYACAILKGMPALVTGMVVYLWLSRISVHSAIWAGGLSLAVLLLPAIVRVTLEALLSLPENLKEGGFALGGSSRNVRFKIIFPAIRRKLLSGIFRSVIRVTGTVAPLMIAVVGLSAMDTDETTTLSLLIWRFFNHPDTVDLMWAASLFLFLVVVLFNFMNESVLKSKNNS